MRDGDIKVLHQSILPPAALCPKVKAGLGGSAAVVSVVSADLPNEKMGGACSAGALGFPKVKPSVAARTGAPLVSLLAPPKTKLDGAGEGATSFFSSGFPKVNVGAAGSLLVCNDPKMEPACGAGAAVLGSPNLVKMEPLVVVVAAAASGAGLAFDVALLGVAVLSLFSSGGAGVALMDDVGAGLVGGLSSGFVTPKLKPPLFSVPEDPVPNMAPPLPPNLNPEAAAAAGWSDFLLSLAVVPNLKPPEEPPNLNPEEAAPS